jgi:hypothetical protein
MTSLQNISQGKYLITKKAIGVQGRGRRQQKIIHHTFFVKSDVCKRGGRIYEYGKIPFGNIKTPLNLVGKRVRIILEVVKPCTPKLKLS